MIESQHGDELLCKLNAFDLEWRLNHEEAKKGRGEAKKQETERKRAERVAQKKAEQEAARALRGKAPRQPRPSRSKHIIAESKNIPPPLSSPDLHAPSCPTLFQLTPLHTLRTFGASSGSFTFPNGTGMSIPQQWAGSMHGFYQYPLSTTTPTAQSTSMVHGNFSVPLTAASFYNYTTPPRHLP
ncbi:hypothetical protein PC9H_008899 [Pleurotus ostreatus]|uniref:Uncharacterized protein n=1 Tax=Pleurotus ostreatus TaxID=5322 RepID=A0A8H6ZPP9_PLEOS|nr:uncharacterized protein PC9H_008899 [Pleurotus ostreatus]KAF7426530.1 hypothetical protein PC9H_008899 [Pleurotus ostreatus]